MGQGNSSGRCILREHIREEFYNDNGTAAVRFEVDRDALSGCPLCGGSMYIWRDNGNGYRSVDECPERKRWGRLYAAYNDARIPARFMECTFNNFSTREIKSGGGAVENFMAYVRGWNDIDRHKGYLFEGGPGTGKTHLLCAAINYLTLQLGVRCRYVDYSNLLSDIRASYGRNEPESVHIEPLVEVPVLFVDELGKGREKTNDFELRIIDEIINRRYLNPDLTTIFASNYMDRSISGYTTYVAQGYDDTISEPQGGTKWHNWAKDNFKSQQFQSLDEFNSHVRRVVRREHIEDRISERTMSRIIGMVSMTINIEAGDYRIRHRHDR